MADIYSLLLKRYPSNEYALMEEVRDKAGFAASRSADYVAVNLWPSRGLAINGIELKSYRSDWLSELKKPEKAENIFQYCDFFWLLTTDETIAKIEEIPENWGWLCIKGEKITVKKDAPKLEPKTLTRHFVCAMLKRAQDKTGYVRNSDIQDKIDDAKKAGQLALEYKVKHAINENDNYRKIIHEFKESSGIDLQTYSSWGDQTTKIGNAVKFIKDGGVESIKQQLTGLEKTAQIVLDRISEGLKSIDNG